MHDLFGPARATLERLDATAGVLVRAAGQDGAAGPLGAAGAVLFAFGPDDPFPAASVIKIPLVMALYADAADGRVDLDERLPVGETVGGTGILRDLTGAPELTLRDLAMLTIGLSDNTATNRLIERLGTARIAERLAEWGCPRTALRRRMFDVEAAKCGLDNVATPSETVALLERLLRGECRDRVTSDAVIALLERCQDDAMLRRYLPHTTRVANKTGTLDATRNDAGVIWGPQRTVLVAAFVRELKDPLAAVHCLGIVGRCAARAAGVDLPPLPFGGAAGA